MLSLSEILSLAVMTVALGYIFSGFIKKPRGPFEIEKKFSLDDLWFAAIVAAPAVILHEFGHKFVAIALGYTATFHVYWFGLGLGIVLKLISSPLMILAPAFVSIPAGVSAFEGFLIALAGPFVNLLLFFVSWYVLKNHKVSHKVAVGLAISKKLNLFLFIFNMIPFPPLDGYHVFTNLLGMF
tara:strand:- start:2946 stop:3494 length:549 start_codon:yes stop_codon:yes gene_type:complete